MKFIRDHKIVLILAIPQIVCLIIFWPGQIQYDHLVEIVSVNSSYISEWHSVIWGWVASAIMMHTGTMGIYGSLQVLIQILIEWTALDVLRKTGIVNDRWITVLAIVYGLSPCYLMYGLLWGTDTVFALLMLLVTTLMIQYAHDHAVMTSRSWMITMITSLFFISQFRKNAILIPVIIGASLLFTSGRKIRPIIVLAVPLLMTGLVALSFSMIGTHPSPVQELLSVPSQQVGLVAKSNGSVSDAARKEFEKVRPWSKWASEYKPTDADFEKEGITDAGGFMKAWMETGARNPGLYVQAWYDLMYPYWKITVDYSNEVHVDDVPADFMNMDKYRDHICLQDNYSCYSGAAVSQMSSMASHNERTEWLSNVYGWVINSKLPIIPDLFIILFFDAALPLISLLSSFCIAGRKRRWLLIFTPAVFIMLTLLAFSPIAMHRYAIELYWIIPVLFAWSISDRKGIQCHQ
jgi:hypothetical protein